MSNLKITQKDIMEMVTRSVNMIINEASTASWKKSIINKIYKATRDVTSHLYRDTDILPRINSWGSFLRTRIC